MKTILHINDIPVTLEGVQRKPGEVSFSLNGKIYHFKGLRLPDGGTALEEETKQGLKRIGGDVWTDKGARRVRFGACEARISEMKAGASAASGAGALSPTAPMPGAVRQILVKKGDKVEKGQALVIVEAMKLQLTLSAGGNAVVEEVLVKVGEQVAEGAELVRLKEAK